MKVLVGCERSGVVREAFRKRGHDAFSCDLVDAEDGSPYHIKGDVRTVLNKGWDLGIFFPDCTYLAVSGLHWNKRVSGRQAKTDDAVWFALQLYFCPHVGKAAMENPVGILSTKIGKPDQIIQPYEFGHDASKKTCLWLRGLPRLVKDPSKYVQPRIVGGKKRWANQTDSGQNKLGPSPTRAMERARTYQGIADSMAQAWG